MYKFAAVALLVLGSFAAGAAAFKHCPVIQRAFGVCACHCHCGACDCCGHARPAK